MKLNHRANFPRRLPLMAAVLASLYSVESWADANKVSQRDATASLVGLRTHLHNVLFANGSTLPLDEAGSVTVSLCDSFHFDVTALSEPAVLLGLIDHLDTIDDVFMRLDPRVMERSPVVVPVVDTRRDAKRLSMAAPLTAHEAAWAAIRGDSFTDTNHKPSAIGQCAAVAPAVDTQALNAATPKPFPPRSDRGRSDWPHRRRVDRPANAGDNSAAQPCVVGRSTNRSQLALVSMRHQHRAACDQHSFRR